MIHAVAPSAFPRACIAVSVRPALREAGFSLLEVLVAVVVLSFGVLGVVGLQAAAVQANKDARFQTAAIRLSRELGDLMRGNKGIAILTGSTNPYLLTDFRGGNTLPFPSAEDCSAAACSSPTAVAQFQIRDWLSRAQIELPGLRVVICFDQSPYTSAGIPQWSCDPMNGLAVVKMGWTRQSTDRSASGVSAVDRASNPSVIVPLIAGS
jgi:type IV pilus assembly protein PilV